MDLTSLPPIQHGPTAAYEDLGQSWRGGGSKDSSTFVICGATIPFHATSYFLSDGRVTQHNRWERLFFLEPVLSDVLADVKLSVSSFLDLAVYPWH